MTKFCLLFHLFLDTDLSNANSLYFLILILLLIFVFCRLYLNCFTIKDPLYIAWIIKIKSSQAHSHISYINYLFIIFNYVIEFLILQQVKLFSFL